MTPPRWLVVLAYWIVSLLLAFVAACWLGGCAIFEPPPYWNLERPAVPIKGVVRVASTLPVCGQDRMGCFYDGMIYIQRGLSIRVEDCVIAHEMKHAAGWTHDDAPHVLDCGDGTIAYREE